MEMLSETSTRGLPQALKGDKWKTSYEVIHSPGLYLLQHTLHTVLTLSGAKQALSTLTPMCAHQGLWTDLPNLGFDLTVPHLGEAGNALQPAVSARDQ